jgi:hypothetical protein
MDRYECTCGSMYYHKQAPLRVGSSLWRELREDFINWIIQHAAA